MAFEFGTNWSELSRISGPIQGPPLRNLYRFRPRGKLRNSSCSAAGDPALALFILDRDGRRSALRSRRSGLAWSTTVGCRHRSVMWWRMGTVSDDWAKIILSPVVWVRSPHMLRVPPRGRSASPQPALVHAAPRVYPRGAYHAAHGFVPCRCPGSRSVSVEHPTVSTSLTANLEDGRDRGAMVANESRHPKCCSRGRTKRRGAPFAITLPRLRQLDRSWTIPALRKSGSIASSK